MKILLTGVTGYIGKRLLRTLILGNHTIYCCVRDKRRFQPPVDQKDKIRIIEIDFLNTNGETKLPEDLDVAYYLIHSMSSSLKNFDEDEKKTANNFKNLVNNTQVRQVIYLGGIINASELSKHLKSRKQVEEILSEGNYHLTTLRAGIIVGSGSASFEIIRDLVEKLPVMIAPIWLKTRCQPLAIRDVISFLTKVQLNEKCYDESFDIGGPDVLTYKEMLLQFAEVRGLRRYVGIVPVMTPRLSSYWLYLVTRVSYYLAVNLVDSMKVEVVAKDNRLQEILNLKTTSYKESVKRAFEKIEQNIVVSSWKDTFTNSEMYSNISEYIEIPQNGCFHDIKKVPFDKSQIQRVVQNIWSIGGKRGWYYGSWLWDIRGWMDRLVGGVGLRRGRTHPNEINAGDALDFWRVLLADKEKKRLLLYAEMKLPGEAWLEFKIDEDNESAQLIQTATFRPKGVLGRVYWYSVLPFHLFVFKGMIRNVVKYQ